MRLCIDLVEEVGIVQLKSLEISLERTVLKIINSVCREVLWQTRGFFTRYETDVVKDVFVDC